MMSKSTQKSSCGCFPSDPRALRLVQIVRVGVCMPMNVGASSHCPLALRCNQEEPRGSVFSVRYYKLLLNCSPRVFHLSSPLFSSSVSSSAASGRPTPPHPPLLPFPWHTPPAQHRVRDRFCIHPVTRTLTLCYICRSVCVKRSGGAARVSALALRFVWLYLFKTKSDHGNTSRKVKLQVGLLTKSLQHP